MRNQVFPVSHRFWVAVSATVLGTALTACMEPQPTPDLPERPSTAFRMTEVVGGLDAPWSVAPLEGGALITEKSGTLLRLGANGSLAEVSGLPGDIYYVDDPQSQAGLFDVVATPNSDRVYISYAYGTPDANGTALMRARLSGNGLREVEVMFRSTPKATNAHYGGKIVVPPDGMPLLTTGDAFVLREAAQDSANTLGKIVRVGESGAEIHSLGHRNPQGLAVDRATGEVWQHEHGPRGGDELNLIQAGGNYGWPIVTAGVDYNGMRISPFETSAEAGGGFTDPVHGWTPSIAASGLAIYRGDLFPDWQGDALVGALAGESLRRLDMENGEVVGEEILLSDLEARIRDVREAPDGSVWVLTNEGEGQSRLLSFAPL